MIVNIIDASKGKPYNLEEPIDNTLGKYKIGIKSLIIHVGWYNIQVDQTWSWKSGTDVATEVTLPAGLYSFQDLVDHLTNEIAGFSITVNKTNGKIDMNIPDNHIVNLTDSIRYMLGLEDEGELSGSYEGDRAVEFLPKRLLIYLKQLSTTNNLVNKNQRLSASQLLTVTPIPSTSFGESYVINFENPVFKQLSTGSISQIDIDFKIQWGNGDERKLHNNDQPIDLILEINT